MKLFWLMLGLSGALTMRGECASARERYVLRSSSNKKFGVRQVWLWDAQRERVLWKREFDHAPQVNWSKDHRSLAVEDIGTFVWREGYSGLHGLIALDDYTMGCVWSPDGRRLLVRYGGSGAIDVGVGTLYCFDLKRWPHYRYFKLGHAAEMRWKNARTVVFQDVDFYQHLHLHVWHVPSKHRKRRQNRRDTPRP